MWQAFGFAVSTAYWPGLLTASFAPRWAVLAVGLPLLSRLDPRLLLPPAPWLLLFGMLWAAVSLSFSPDPLGGTLDLFTLGVLCLAMIAGSGMGSFEPIVKGLLLGLAVSSALAIAQTMGLDWPRQSAPPAGLFLNSEVMAEFAAPLFVWCAQKPRLGLLLIPAVPLILCGSRIAALAVIAGLLYAWRSRQLPSLGWRGRTVLSAALVLGFGLIGAAAFFVRPESAHQRYDIWITLISSLSLPGQGLGWFQATHPNWAFGHSDALQLLAELGLGGVPFLLIPVMALWVGRGEGPERAMLFSCCITSLVSFPVQLPAGGFLLAVLSGYLLGPRRLLRGRGRFRWFEGRRDLRWTRAQHVGNSRAVGAGGGDISIRAVVSDYRPEVA